MKIPGTPFEIKLVIKSTDSTIIEFQILKNNVITFSLDLSDFPELKKNFRSYLEKQGISIAANKSNDLLQTLEGDYLELEDQTKKKRTKDIAHQQTTTKVMAQTINRGPSPQKFLIMGLSEAGKTSIYQVLFKGKMPHETRILQPTRGVERYEPLQDQSSEVKQPSEFIIWELGGQKQFLDRYFQEPEKFFTQTSCLIFIIDAYNIERFEEARLALHKAIYYLERYGTKPKFLPKEQSNIFCFLHKMDLFPNPLEKYESMVNYFSLDVESKKPRTDINFYSTSIYDNSVFSSWAKISRIIMPKSAKLNLLAQEFKNELNLFATFVIERRTGLPICGSETLMDDTVIVGDTDRLLIFIDNLLKDFNLVKTQEVKISTSNGILELRIFNQYFILVLLYPVSLNVCDPDVNAKITQFIESMQKNI